VLQLRALGNVGLTIAGYVDIVLKKTAALFAASAECGAIMGGASALRVKALRDFGLYYGIAFQMLDDVLDASADADELGKPVGNDLRERKMTLPVIFALEFGPGDLRAYLKRHYLRAGGDEDPGAIRLLLDGIAQAGALEKSREAIAGYVERAKMSLAPLGKARARTELARLADALLRSGERATR
jgi:octaprenyl-diphosphate synthase